MEYKMLRTLTLFIALCLFATGANAVPPLLARGMNIATGQDSLVQNVWKNLVWKTLSFDTDPNRVASTTSGLIVLSSGTDNPSDKFYLRGTGYYEITSQVHVNPTFPALSNWQETIALALYDYSTTGSGSTKLSVSSSVVSGGYDTTIYLTTLVKNSTANTYYGFKMLYTPLYVDKPATLLLNTDSDNTSTWFEIKYLGPLT